MSPSEIDNKQAKMKSVIVTKEIKYNIMKYTRHFTQ